MNEHLQKAIQTWMQLRPREQTLIGTAAVLIGLMMVYSIVWEPVVDNVAHLKVQVKEEQDLVVWMQNAAKEVKQLTRGQGGNRSTQGQSLLAIIDSSAKIAKLEQAVKRVEPDSQNKVRVWLESAVFDDVAKWLAALSSTYGVEIESASIDKEAVSGRVSARFEFKGSS
ncbi:MAG: type II secretion system protein M [Gammaproteobacteria bacterium]|nr:type II secretion system protein M [Gammaproteobacteria bacterium]